MRLKKWMKMKVEDEGMGMGLGYSRLILTALNDRTGVWEGGLLILAGTAFVCSMECEL